MHFRYCFFYMLLLYTIEAKPREVVCPEYCTCDVVDNFKRANCQSKRLVSVEIGMPPEVELLDLSYNQISELGNKAFSDLGLTQLKFLNLSNNKISQIHMFAFEELNQLNVLDLSYNIMEYILEQWFSSWQNLEELYLEGNNFMLINKQPPLNLPLLRVLDLSQSKIEHFSPTVFSQLPNLQFLNISSNYIQRLNVEVIVPLKSLKVLVVEDNSLQCKERSISMLKRYIRKQDITYIGPCIQRRKLVGSTTTLSPSTNTENAKSVFPKEKQKELEKLVELVESVNESPISQNPFEKLRAYETSGSPEIEESVATEIVEGEENVNKPKTRKKSDTSGDTDPEILKELQMFMNSDQFKKMEENRRNRPKPDISNFSNDDKIEITNNRKPEKIDDVNVLNDLKKYFDAEKNNKASASNSNSAPNTINNNKPLSRNSWLIDDEENDNNDDGNECEDSNGNLIKTLKRMIRKALEMYPSWIVFLCTAVGFLLGVCAGLTLKGKGLLKNVPKLNGKKGGKGFSPSNIINKFLSNDKKGGNKPEKEEPISDEEVVNKEEDNSNQSAPSKSRKKKVEKEVPRKSGSGKNRRRSKSPKKPSKLDTEEQHLIDEVESQDDSRIEDDVEEAPPRRRRGGKPHRHSRSPKRTKEEDFEDQVLEEDSNGEELPSKRKPSRGKNESRGKIHKGSESPERTQREQEFEDLNNLLDDVDPQGDSTPVLGKKELGEKEKRKKGDE